MNSETILSNFTATYKTTRDFMMQNAQWGSRKVRQLVDHTGLPQTSAWQNITPKVANQWKNLRSGYGVAIGISLFTAYILYKTLESANRSGNMRQIGFKKHIEEVRQDSFIARITTVVIIAGLFVSAGLAASYGHTQIL